MSNEWYNPYDPNIQWGNGLADLIDAFGPQLKKLLGGGGRSSRIRGNQPTGTQVMGEPNMGPVGAGGEGFGNPQQTITPYMNTGTGPMMGGGSPAQFIGGQQGGGQMSPEVMRILAAIMQAMRGSPNI